MKQTYRIVLCAVTILLLCALIALTVVGILKVQKDTSFIKEGDSVSFGDIRGSFLTYCDLDVSGFNKEELADAESLDLACMTEEGKLRVFAPQYHICGQMPVNYKVKKASVLQNAEITLLDGRKQLRSNEILLPYEIYYRLQVRDMDAYNKDTAAVLKKFCKESSRYDNVRSKEGYYVKKSVGGEYNRDLLDFMNAYSMLSNQAFTLYDCSIVASGGDYTEEKYKLTVAGYYIDDVGRAYLRAVEKCASIEEEGKLFDTAGKELLNRIVIAG